MEYYFTCYGHENVTAKHKTTLEFTKDSDLGLEGDCIIGARADFDLKGIRNFIEKLSNNKNNEVTIIIQTIKDSNKKNKINQNNLKDKDENVIEKINAEINPGFNSDKEMVIRKTDFISERTLAIRADKAAFELDKDLIRFLREKENKIKICIRDKQ